MTATDTGTTLRVSGPKDVLEAFQAVLEDEQREQHERALTRSRGCSAACHPSHGDAVFFGVPDEASGATRL